HRLLPACLALRRQWRGLPAGAMHGSEMHDQVAKEMQHAAGVFFAEAAHRTVSAARVERKDRFEMRRILPCDMQLLGAETGNPDHADIAVAPALLRDPFDQVIAVPQTRGATAVGLADAAGRADDVDIAARDEEFC